MDKPPAIAIMAGGQSRRMGRDKARIELDGKTLLDRLIDQALRVTDTVAVVGRTGRRDDVIWLEDDQPGLGPLGGLKTALGHLERPVLLVACDMPLVDADALAWLIDSWLSDVFDQRAHPAGLATTRHGHLEPLFSIYAPAVLPLVDERIAAERLSARRLIEKGDFARAEAPGEVAKKLENVNTPEDLDALGDLE